jgi:hypothetical protein
LAPDGTAMFKDVPPCNVIATVSANGFATKKVMVDLATYRDGPIPIELK